MARRADWDNDDDFEILNPEKFEVTENDTFEIIPSKNQPSSLINTNPIIPHVPIIEQPVSIPIEINQVKQSLENSSPTNVNYLPTRYGSAAIIPHDEGFDLKSILASRPSLTNQTNDLLTYIQKEKSKKHSFADNDLKQLLIDNHQDRQSLVQIAKQAQQDFINAIQLD